MNKKIRTSAVETLFEAIIKLESVDECFDFFEDLATINEILSLSQRFEVARMLRQHKTYLEIAEKEAAGKKPVFRNKIPWQELLKEDIEITGSRSIKSFFMPWKE